jgi:DNA gyrase/topoisomerase IV subunit A
MSSAHWRIHEPALWVGALLALSGCSASSGSGHSGTDASSKNVYDRNGKLVPSAEIARLRVERDRLQQANQLLEQELAETHEDLKLVEQQFAIYEERLISDQGKAAAVAASAEARIRCEKLERERPNVLADSTERYVKELIESSDRLIKKQNYAAAQFFAERANHTMSSAERRATIEGSATTRTVAVDAANVREGPGQGYSVVDRLATGATLLCWGSANDWYHVRTPNGVEGWIHASLVR